MIKYYSYNIFAINTEGLQIKLFYKKQRFDISTFVKVPACYLVGLFFSVADAVFILARSVFTLITSR